MKMIPEVSNNGVPTWLGNFLHALRVTLLRRFYGHPNRLEKVVTFKDLVDMGVVTGAQALEQAEKE